MNEWGQASAGKKPLSALHTVAGVFEDPFDSAPLPLPLLLLLRLLSSTSVLVGLLVYSSTSHPPLEAIASLYQTAAFDKKEYPSPFS